MKVTIQNILKHHALEVDIDPSANLLITGKNASGKTSMAIVLAALMGLDPNPKAVSATTRKSYISDDTSAMDGYASLSYLGGADAEDVEVVWYPATGEIRHPEEITAFGSPETLGLVEFTKNQTEKNRAKLYENLFLPEDADAILRPHWHGKEDVLANVLDMIKQRGWPGALAVFDDRRKKAVSEWRRITGEPYGKNKVANWVPTGWRDDLYNASADALNKALADLLAEQQTSTVAVAVDAQKVADMKAREGKLTQAMQEVDRLQKIHDEKQDALRVIADTEDTVRQNITNLTRERDEISAVLTAKPPHQCPVCEAGLAYDGELSRWFPPRKEDIESAKARSVGVNVSLSIQESRLTAAQSEREIANKALGEAYMMFQKKRGEAESLGREVHEFQKGTKAMTGKKQVSQEELTRLEHQIDVARENVHLHKAKMLADDAANGVIENETICTLIGPSGARAQAMSGGMDTLRDHIAALDNLSEWAQTTIDPKNYQINHGGRPIALCSESEQRKANWVIQLAYSIVSDDRYVIIDAADLLRDESWDGLIKICDHVKDEYGKTVIICATSSPSPEGWGLHTLDD